MRIPNLRRVFRLDVLAPCVERDVGDELAFHFDETVRALVAAGWTEARARDEAERRFGDVRRYRATLTTTGRARARSRRLAATWEAVRDDLRHTSRALRRRP